MLRVLIIDDQVSFRRQLARLLVYAGLDVVGEANDINEAEKIARTQQPDLAIVEIMLPKMNGFDGIPALKAASSCMQIILVSAYNDRTQLLRQAAKEAGADAFFPKDELDFNVVNQWKEIQTNQID